MKHLRWLLLLVPLLAFGQSHEQVLSTLGNPMPANSVFCNSLGVAAPAKTCIAGTNISISGGTISAAGGSGSGSVSSVGVTTSAAWLTVGNSPIVSSGNISVNPTTGLTQNRVLASPNGSSGAVSLRALVGADIPQINLSISGNGGAGGVAGVSVGGTGQTTASAAINALLPSQTGQSGNFLTTNGTVASWAAGGGSGSTGFDSLTGGTNLAAAMLVGTGSSLGPTGSGTVNANEVNGVVVPTSSTVAGVNSSGQIVSRAVTGSGTTVVLATSPTLTTPSLGAATATTESITGNGAVSAPAFLLSGAPYTGGSGTTTYPYIYGNDGTSPTTWSTSGTYLGFNAPSGFTGNFADYHVNGGASVYKVTYQGNLTGGTYNGSTIPTSAGTLPGTTGAFTATDCVIVASITPTIFEDGGACTGVGSATTGQILYNNSGSVGGKTTVPIANGGTGQATLAAAAIVTVFGTPTATDCVEWKSAVVVEDAGSGCGGGGSSANPSAKVGPTATNGSAMTFMTSDSAPAIDLTAAYTWTGAHSFSSTLTLKDSGGGGPFNVGYLGAPDNTTAISYTLVAADRGKRVTVTVTGKVITIPHAVFADGDVVTILFDTAGTATLTPDSSFTLNWANGTTSTYGTGSAGNRTLTGWAVATLIFTSSSVAYLTGTGIS